MKKLLIILGALFLLFVVGVVVFSFVLGSIVTKGVNTFAPKVTGTNVVLESAYISPFTGSGTFKGLFVGNPTGWKSDKAFSFAKVHASIAPTSLLGDHIIVNEVLIDGPEFVYETNIVRSNIKDLLANIEKFTGGAKEQPAEKPADESTAEPSKPIKFEVKSFRLENAKVTIGVGAAAITLPMPPLVLTNLGTAEGGITPDQLATKVIGNVLSNITKVAAESTLKAGGAVGDAATDAAKKAGEGLKKLFGGDK